jgi:hypothetical protein
MVLIRQLAVAGVVALMSLGCTDSNDPVDSFTIMGGNWAGKSWAGDARAFLGAGDTLWIGGDRGPEYVSLRVVVKGPGEYVLGPGAAKLIQTVGGDVLLAEYVTTTSAAGTLRITSYRGVGEIVEGQFDFEAATTSPHGSYGSNASMKDGYFRAKVSSFVTQ